MPTVELTFSPLAAHVRTARLVATAVARRAGVEDALLDEVRLAVGEACSRAVALHARYAPDTPVEVCLTDEPDEFTVVVIDRVRDSGDELAGGLSSIDPMDLVSPDSEPGPLPSGFGLAVVTSLVDDAEVERTTTGTTVTLRWKAPATGLAS
ncbi:MAG: serine/threonine-protein kinase RsbW [Frankiales bacterium]|nr:serine/threonine-protein kinase RsbW [Frankiales bacterium]MDX6275446.1 serine/threonine-protein kinase RsbW [Frankiales bacterium]